MGAGGGSERFWADGVFYRVSENQWSVRRVGKRLPSELHEPECAGEAECAGNDPAVGAGGTLAVCAHKRHPGRWSKPGPAGNDEGSKRRFSARGFEEHGCGGKRRMAEEASEGQLRALAGR